MRDIIPGDRFEDGYYFGLIFEIIEIVTKHKSGRSFDVNMKVISKGSSALADGEECGFWLVTMEDKFLGNFNKSDKFQELYNLLDT